MQFIVSSEALFNALKLIGKIPSTPIVPVVENYLFELEDNKLKITTTDIITTCSTTIHVDGAENISGKFLIDGVSIWNLLKNTECQPIIMSFEEREMKVYVMLDSAEYFVCAGSYLDFPRIPNIQEKSVAETIVPESVLYKIIDSVGSCMSKEQLRPAMCGILFEIGHNNVNFIATDGHRLAKATYKLQNNLSGDFILTSDAIIKIKKLIKKKGTSRIRFRFLFNHNLCFIDFLDERQDYAYLSMVSRTQEEKFPDYLNAIPAETKECWLFSVRSQPFLKSLKRLIHFSNVATRQVKLKVYATHLYASAEDLDFFNSGSEKHEVEFSKIAEAPFLPFEIGFNIRLLSDAISKIKSDRVEFRCIAPNRATTIQYNDEDLSILFLIMPIMLNNYV